jgi:hypothetical protein
VVPGVSGRGLVGSGVGLVYTLRTMWEGLGGTVGYLVGTW